MHGAYDSLHKRHASRPKMNNKSRMERIMLYTIDMHLVLRLTISHAWSVGFSIQDTRIPS